MSIDNKKINIVSDVNFNGNNITDAKINAQENTISNLEVSNFKSGVIQTTVRDTTNALDTVIPTEKAVSEALSNIQINVVELDEGTNIDNLRQEGTFFIKNPTGTLPSAVSTGNTYWCILTQEKCYDDLNLGTYWYLQTAKFSYLGAGPGMGTLPSWQTYTRQITDYQYVTGNTWQRLDNLAERFFSNVPGTEGADLTITLNTCSDAESVAIVNAGWITGLNWRSIKSLTLSTGLLGSCKIFFKTYSGGMPPYTPFSITLDGTISSQIINSDVLTNYNFKASTVYEIDFQKIGSADGKVSVRITEINKPFVQEYFPSQTGNSGKFLTTDGTTMSWAEVQGGSSATITYFDSTNWTLDVTNTTLSTGLSLGNVVTVFKNGQLLQSGASNDYTISSNNITFTEPLVSTDKIAVINGNMNPMQSVGYNTFSNKSVLSTDWQSSSEYSGYIYEYAIPCTGVTSTMYAQVTFAPEEAMSGNYANVCDTGTGTVTIYSKVNDAITIPMIMVLGV